MFTRQRTLVCAFFLVLGVFLARLPTTIAQVTGTTDWAQALSDVQRLINERYVEKPDDEALLKGAIKGMVDSLDDQYTEFIPPADRASFEKQLTGQFVGIGATVNTLGGWLTVVYPLEDSPAYAAGLLPDDKIAEIEGKPTKGLSVDDCVKRLMGEPGTPVKLLVKRGATGPDLTGGQDLYVTIIRQAIAARTVKGFRWNPASQAWDHMIDPANGIAYVRLTQFTPSSADELMSALALAASTRPGAKLGGLILDLRDNPGGLLEQAIEISNLFMNSGTIVSTKGRSGKEQTWSASTGSPYADLPIVILVNQSSASASEIVSGALSDNQRAVIVGVRSFGKGLVQRVEQLSHVPGAQLKLTEQHYYLPSGRMIQRTDSASTWGVDPSPGFYVPLTDPEQITVNRLRRDMDVIQPVRPSLTPSPDTASGASSPPLHVYDKIYAADAKWNDPAWIDSALGEKQLGAALKAVQARIADGAWKPSGEALPEQVKRISNTELARLDRLRERYEHELLRLDRRIDALTTEGLAKAESLHPSDLWEGDPDLTGGRLDVYDKGGKKIATLDITGPELERWLADADVRARAATPDVSKGAEPADAPAKATP